jgi:hypothetical protein
LFNKDLQRWDNMLLKDRRRLGNEFHNDRRRTDNLFYNDKRKRENMLCTRTDEEEITYSMRTDGEGRSDVSTRIGREGSTYCTYIKKQAGKENRFYYTDRRRNKNTLYSTRTDRG